MATMNVGSSDVANQDEIARQMESAIADDSSTKTSSNVEQEELVQGANIVSSESGSFVRISTTEGSNVSVPQASKTSTVALDFGGGSGPRIQDDSSQVSSQGVWGWISSAVGSDIVQTTQRLGRNLVQKTKVVIEQRGFAHTNMYYLYTIPFPAQKIIGSSIWYCSLLHSGKVVTWILLQKVNYS